MRLPLGIRLLRDTRRNLLRGARGADKVPGEVRRSQNWIGGSRHGNARFVPLRPRTLLMPSWCWSGGGTPIATSRRWCGPDSRTYSSRRSTHSSTAAVRSNGDWEGWVRCFLECVREAAGGGVRVAQALHALVGQHRRHTIARDRPTVAAIELREHLPSCSP